MRVAPRCFQWRSKRCAGRSELVVLRLEQLTIEADGK